MKKSKLNQKTAEDFTNKNNSRTAFFEQCYKSSWSNLETYMFYKGFLEGLKINKLKDKKE